MLLTTPEPRLDGREVATTALAVVASTGLYARYGHPYLARGVVGDIAGLAAGSLPLILHHRRLRHEALVCFAGISAIHASRMRWPLRFSGPVWWSAIALALLAYVPLRRFALRPHRQTSLG